GTCTTATIFESILFTSRDVDIIKYLIQNGCTPSVKDLQSKPFLSFRCRTFRRSLVALILRAVQDEVFNMQTARTLLSMLEASGYQLTKDSFCRHLMDIVSRLSANIHQVNWDDNGDVVLLTSQVDFAMRPFHWSGLWAALDEDIVTYVNGLISRMSKPPQIPSLSSICRMRIRGRLYETQRVHQLHKFVDQLPLPSVFKRYLTLEDF
ncbi:hypothetical protein EGW08_012587, partial [Elysia chlorotica]